ncbi:MAG: HAMP domain-containing sensor histidine kinase [Pirellulaceae bacterium]
MIQTGMLPSISFRGNRWWLPLSSRSANVIAQAFLSLYSTNVEKGLSNLRLADFDPALSIWLMLEHSACGPTCDASVNAIAKSDLTLLVNAFGSSDRLRDAPTASDQLDNGWRHVWHNLSLRDDPVAWLEVTGPEIPEAWRSRWHTRSVASTPPTDVAEGCPDYGRNQLDLAMLLRSMQRLRLLSDNFADHLHNENVASMRQLAYGLSHEINNPLANISTRAQSLMRDETSVDRKRMLQAIVKQAMRAYEMIADMMFFANPPKPVCGRIDLSECVRRIATEASPDLAARSIKLTTDIADHCSLSTDPSWIADALRALIRNAAEAIDPPGQIHIQLVIRDASCELIVYDSGEGLNANERRHAFDPFFSGREAGRGLGLGLCKTERIVQSLGGKIELVPSPIGAKVVIELPF